MKIFRACRNTSPLVLALFVLVLSACTTTPITQPRKGIDLQQQEARFQEARSLFFDKQYTEASTILMPLAQQGHAASQYSIGYMYYYGYGLPHNEREAMHWISIAAARGNLKAQQALKLLETHPQKKQALPR